MKYWACSTTTLVCALILGWITKSENATYFLLGAGLVWLFLA